MGPETDQRDVDAKHPSPPGVGRPAARGTWPVAGRRLGTALGTSRHAGRSAPRGTPSRCETPAGWWGVPVVIVLGVESPCLDHTIGPTVTPLWVLPDSLTGITPRPASSAHSASGTQQSAPATWEYERCAPGGGLKVAATTQSWGSFGQLVGAASGALIGLLFVAVSLNRDRVARNPMLHASAVQTLVIFMLPLTTSIVLLTPGQPSWVLGSELLALGALQGVVLVISGRRKRRPDLEPSRLARVLDHTSPNLAATSLVLIAGATLVSGHGGGLYWLVPAVILALVGGSANAWLFLILDSD